MDIEMQPEPTANGTHLVGYIDCSYAELVDIFGLPKSGDSWKVRAHWVMRLNGLLCTIYDWKCSPEWSDEGVELTEVTTWNVGGFSSDSKLLIEQYVPQWHDERLSDQICLAEQQYDSFCMEHWEQAEGINNKGGFHR